MKLFKNKKEQGRREQGVYKKQQSYHYSANRSGADRRYGRREDTADAANARKDRYLSKVNLLPSLVAFVLIVVGCFYLLHISPSAIIQSQGDKEFIGDRSAVEAKADELLGSSLLNRTKLTFNEQNIEDELTAEFPEFSNIDVQTFFLRQRPVITITFATPTLLLTTGSNNYVISEEGVVLADITNKKPDFDTSELLLVQDQTGVDIEVGKVALTSEQVDYILGITYQTNKKNLKVQSLMLMPGGGELHARYGGITYFVKYNLYEDARMSSGTFLATKADLENKGVTPAQYIDVRIPERAYIR